MAGIERINGFENQGEMISPNSKISNGDNSGSAPFSLDDENEGVIYEPETARRPQYKTLEETKAEVAREEAQAAKANLHSRFDGPGVAVELSTEAVSAASEAKKKANEQSIFDIIKDTLNQIKQFFVGIWTGGEETNTPIIAEAEEDSSGVKVELSSSEKNSMDNEAESIASFMTNYGGRKLAKNSDLLTQYDRSGKITSPSASDRRRILQGDGKVRHY